MIDAHHHIWRQADLPWLLGPEQPRIFGPYAAIRRDYLIDEYRAEAEAAGVTGSVYVQANWSPNWFEDEVSWVQSVADATGWPHGVVGYVDLTVEDARPHLDRLMKYPRMRGIRQQLHWHQTARYRFAARPDLAEDPALQANVARLAEYGLVFELQVFAPQMAGAAALAAAAPDTTLVLQHAGMLEDGSEAGRAAWKAGMKKLAAERNVVCKLSGFGTFIQRNDPAFIAEMIAAGVDLFGARRCLFGSNFPIEKLWTSYGDLVAAFRDGAAKLSEGQRKAIFHDTAARVYRLQS